MLLLLGLLLLFGLVFWLKRRRKPKLAIYLTDHYMRIDEPIPICGTPDVIWIDNHGVLIVGDYKSRASRRVQESDIIQLSVYKVLLEHTQSRPVANKGYIHFKDGHQVCVKLLDEQTIINFYHKYQQIIRGKAKAQCTNKRGYCQYCSYLDICR